MALVDLNAPLSMAFIPDTGATNSDRGVQTASFSTATFRAPEATAAWREVFGRTSLHIDIKPLPKAFRAEAKVVRWPGFAMIEASTSAVHQANSRGLISSDDVCFGGIVGRTDPNRRIIASQLRREAELFAGDAVLMSNGEIGSITLPSECRYRVFSISASALRPLVPDMSASFARRVPSDRPEMRMLSRYLRLARDERCLATPELRKTFADHVVDLLALSIGAVRGVAELAEARGGRAARLHAIKADIRSALHRPDLRVGLIAAWHNVSPRYVQILFEQSGSTFTRYVLEERLEVAHRALMDATLSISAVVYACGFTDLSNFNRAFRKRFGCTPTDVRLGARDGREWQPLGATTTLRS